MAPGERGQCTFDSWIADERRLLGRRWCNDPAGAPDRSTWVLLPDLLPHR